MKLLLLGLLIGALSGGALAATPTPTPTKALAATPSPTSTKALAATPSPTPTKSLAATPTPTPTPADTVAGFWEQSDGDGNVGAWFYFSRVKGLWQGRLVKLFKPPNVADKDLVTTCVKCDGDQKDAPMLGLTIVKGLHRDGRKYQDGTILDPRDGSVYRVQMELSADGQTLAVRGYLGIPLLGQTQTWNRLPDETQFPPTRFRRIRLAPRLRPSRGRHRLRRQAARRPIRIDTEQQGWPEV